mmetsp:Transcript_6148/g.12480  ORF Transcript_6148/g.12480 Transcript_6148/m.12480 type:complete len:258 (+) Transcript_6148:431-1204(+)
MISTRNLKTASGTLRLSPFSRLCPARSKRATTNTSAPLLVGSMLHKKTGGRCFGTPGRGALLPPGCAAQRRRVSRMRTAAVSSATKAARRPQRSPGAGRGTRRHLHCPAREYPRRRELVAHALRQRHAPAGGAAGGPSGHAAPKRHEQPLGQRTADRPDRVPPNVRLHRRRRSSARWCLGGMLRYGAAIVSGGRHIRHGAPCFRVRISLRVARSGADPLLILVPDRPAVSAPDAAPTRRRRAAMQVKRHHQASTSAA